MARISADKIAQVREDLYRQLDEAVDELRMVVGDRDNPTEVFAHLDLLRSLFDALGWTPRDPETDVDDGPIVQALRTHLTRERELAESQDEDQRLRANLNVLTIEAMLSIIAKREDLT
jgi:DNA replication initiation complex subunit (GINS family)